VGNAGATFAAPGYTVMPGHFDTPMYQKYSLEIQQQLTKNDSVSIGYNGNHGRNIAMADGMVNAYVRKDGYGVPPNGVVPYPTAAPDSRFKAVTQYETVGFSNYNGMTVSWTHRTGFGLQGQVNYTWSHSQDTISDSGGAGNTYSGDSITGVMFPGRPDANYASSDYDMRHVITGNLVWQPRFDKWLGAPKMIGGDWNITGTFLYKTGTPFTVAAEDVTIYNSGAGPATLIPIMTGNQFNCDSGAAKTPCLSGDTFASPSGADATISPQRRNMFRAPGYFNMDMSILKGFQIFPGHENAKLFLGMNAYNLLNHPNFGTPCSDISACQVGLIQSTVSPATSPYGSFTGSAASARILQFSAKFQF